MALRTPPLREVHADHGAKFTEFGGWDMPVEFDSIRAEHTAVREAVGRFDVSHMGEIEVTGPDATELMQRLTTNDVTELAPGDAQYAAVTTAEGILIDDTVVYRLPDGTVGDSGGADYLFIPNAGHDADAHERWITHRDEWELDATVRNATEEWAMFAVQGPEAEEAVRNAVDTARDAVTALSRFTARFAEVDGVRCWVARTGYTGEDGFELLCPWGEADTVWESFDDVQSCGLGARDTLRIEMGFLLSGQDFDPEENPRTPYEAGIGFVVDLDATPPFVGHGALAGSVDTDRTEAFVGIELQERGVARNGYEVVNENGHVIGTVTSGTVSPTLGTGVALGYLPDEYTDPGTEVGVMVRGQEKRAKVVSPPFLPEKR